MGVLIACKPRKEVLKGDLEDAIFAADFGDLISGKAPSVYAVPKVFFQNTHPAKQLCKVIQTIFGRLANPSEGGATIRLSTGFGGGKTHTLMALWHLAQNVGDPSLGTELLPAAGRPRKVTVAAVDLGKAGAVFGRHGKLETRSLWGELAFRLGGEKAAKMLADVDDPEKQPDEPLIGKIFPGGPILILLDELVIYMATLSERGQGNLLAFLNKLAAVVGKHPQAVLVVTDPADQRAYAQQSQQLGTNLSSAATKLDDLFGRKMTDFDPIGEESARVIVRRLFESVDASAAQAVSATYHSLYDRVIRDLPGTIPPAAASADYSRRIVDCYPFHPRLLDTAQGRLAALQEFHKSRGTLRLFARILRTVWESKEDFELITAGDLDWSSDRIQADLLQRINRDSFKSAVSSDIETHAVELDSGNRRGIHVRVASALLLESIPMQSNSGFDPADLTLAVLRPDEAGPEPSEALNRLVGVCWHTYPMMGGRGWQFRYEPNIIKQIEERMGQIPVEDAKSRVLSEVQGYFAGPTFKLSPWPTTAKQVPEAAELQLVLCETEKVARLVSAFSDDSDPQSPMPRLFQNAVIAVTATTGAFSGAIERAQRLLAAEAIEREHKTGDSNKIVREQLQRIKPDLVKHFRIQTCRAFDRVVLAGGMAYSLEEEFIVPEEEMLRRPQGQVALKRFLEAKNLVYQEGDALDLGRFVKDILPGATPLADPPHAYTAKAIHERFLGAPGLRLLPDGGVVRRTLLKALDERRIVIQQADGRAYDSKGCVEGSYGQRHRTPARLASLTLDERTQVTLATSETGVLWTREDPLVKEGGKKHEGGAPPPPPPPPPPPAQVRAISWEKVLEYAAQRPLLDLHLAADKPAAAATLAGLASPLGAESLTLSVNVGGILKDGGTVQFAVSEVKLTHPIKPLQVAQTLFNAVGESVGYEVVLALKFGHSGRSGMADLLRKIKDEAPEGISAQALFDKPVEASR